MTDLVEATSGVKEHRVYGAPGSGKTTFLSKQIKRAAEQFGPDAVIVASFTKTAATEIAGRDLGLGDKQVGTLHSFAYRAIGGAKVVEDRKGLEAWNNSHPRADRQLSSGKTSEDDLEFGEAGNKTRGDYLFGQYKLLRNRMTPRELWETDVLLFAEDWEDFKEQLGGIDFTDMIELALGNEALPYGFFEVMFLDETQDLSPLELAYARLIGNSASMHQFVVAGDYNQTIYAFKGATPKAFLEPEVPRENTRVLSKSHRVPREIHAFAGAWQLLPLEHEPRDAAGAVFLRPDITPRSAIFTGLFDDVEELLTRGESVMLLASASYLLKPLVAALKDKRLPFGNVYRPSQWEWNPLKRSKAWDTVSRLYAFLRDAPELWGTRASRPTYAELWSACEPLHDGAFNHQSKGILRSAAMNKRDKDTFVDVREFLPPAAVSGPPAERAAWYIRNCYGKKRDDMLYVLELVHKYGWQVLTDTPLLTVGTVHSVKGGQADHVYIFPELSPSAARAWYMPSEERDAIIRTFYVGLTRAKETITLLGSDDVGVAWFENHAPAGGLALLPDFNPTGRAL